jgi:hypothetical protein
MSLQNLVSIISPAPIVVSLQSFLNFLTDGSLIVHCHEIFPHGDQAIEASAKLITWRQTLFYEFS